ncbi:MAG TPA: hypothetical protein VF155_11710 [Candidatus Dormibacteraeota bacterium]
MPRKPPGPDTKLTPGDLATLNYIASYTFAYGHPPSLRQVAKGRGHGSHGPTQRSVNALINAGRLQRLPDGSLKVPGLTSSGLSLAAVLDSSPRQWVVAPEPGLVAWRLDTDVVGFSAHDLVFVRLGTAETGDLVLAYHDGIRKNASGYVKDIRIYQVRRVTGHVTTDVAGHPIEQRARGRLLYIVGPVRYVQHEIRPQKPA